MLHPIRPSVRPSVRPMLWSVKPTAMGQMIPDFLSENRGEFPGTVARENNVDKTRQCCQQVGAPLVAVYQVLEVLRT